MDINISDWILLWDLY